MLVAIAAAAAGLLAGTVALASFAYFVRELKDRKFPKAAPAFIVGLLFGSTIASAPIGKLVVGEADVWPYYMIGEALVFLPGAIFVVYRYLAVI